jgi:hypothetical protein
MGKGKLAPEPLSLTSAKATGEKAAAERQARMMAVVRRDAIFITNGLQVGFLFWRWRAGRGYDRSGNIYQVYDRNVTQL